MKMYNEKQVSPEGTYRYALNMVHKIEDGTANELIDETGNSIILTIPNNYKVIGSVESPSGVVYLFLQTDFGYNFKIWEVEGSNHTEILDTECWRYENTIKGEFRILNVCDKILYFYDGVEPDRYFNLTHPEYHKDPYDNWDCNSFLLKPVYLKPSIKLESMLNDGGNLKSGAYNLYVRYVDKADNRTDWSLPSESYYVYDEVYSELQLDSIQGSDPDKFTRKVLNFKITNVDTRYDFLEYAISVNKTEAVIYGKRNIASNELIINIRDMTAKVPITYAELITPTAKYENSKVMVQQDNRLVRANLTEKNIDWAVLQRLANDAVIEYNVNAVSRACTIDYSHQKSMMRDETYAIGLVFEFDDGSISPVFHIPGRKKDYYFQDIPIPSGTMDFNTHNRYLPDGGWDSTEYDPFTDAAIDSDSRHIVPKRIVERWEICNTAISYHLQVPLTVGTGCPAYTECRDSEGNPILYPDIRDCDGQLIYPHNDDGSMQVIRHHKMPDNTLEPLFDEDFIYPLQVMLKFNIPLPEQYPQIVGYRLAISDRNYEKTILDKGIITQVIKNDYKIRGGIDKNDYVKHQSLQFSKNNRLGCSFSIVTGDSGSTGTQYFMSIPASSQIINYHANFSDTLASNPVSSVIDEVCFHSPKTFLNNQSITGSFLKFEREIIDNNVDIVAARRIFTNKLGANIPNTLSKVTPRITHIPVNEMTNRSVLEEYFIPTNSDNVNLLNSTQQLTTLFKLDIANDNSANYYEELLGSAYGTAGNIQTYSYCVPSRYVLAERWFGDNGLDWRTNDGDQKMSYQYVAIKNHIPDIYSDLNNIKYTLCENEGDVYSGDIWISRFAFKQTYYGFVPHAEKFGLFGENTGNDELIGAAGAAIDTSSYGFGAFEAVLIDTFYETDVNAELREGNDSSLTTTFYPRNYKKYKDFLQIDLSTDKVSQLTADGQADYFGIAPNYYKLQDYYNQQRKYAVEPINNDKLFCDSCKGEFPNRIIWSEQSFYSQDNYRRYLVNNFKDVLGKSIDITDIFELRNQLFLQTKESLFELPRTSESLEVTGQTLAIGTGAYLSLPQRALSNLTHNYLGNQGRFNRFSTEFGIFFCNQKQGTIYNIKSGDNPLTEISADYGQWFINNLPSDMQNYWKQTFNTDYPHFDNLTHDYGVGLQSTMDYQLGRWILHKKDYYPLYPVNFENIGEGQLYFDGQKFWDWNENIITFENVDYFENRCFTMSYNMEDKEWLSFHSYQPFWMYQDGNTFYTMPRLFAEGGSNYDIYKHNDGEPKTFYGMRFPSVIEWQISNTKSVVNSLSYYARFQEFNGTLRTWQDVDGEFNQGFLYNTYQTTFMFGIGNSDTYLWNDSIKNSIVRENIHTINGFRQLNLDSNVITKEWNVLKNSYSNGQGYENYVSIEPSGYVSKFHLQNPIRDIFTNARLYYFENPRMRFQTVTKDTTNSIR